MRVSFRYPVHTLLNVFATVYMFSGTNLILNDERTVYLLRFFMSTELSAIYLAFHVKYKGPFWLFTRACNYNVESFLNVLRSNNGLKTLLSNFAP